MRKDRFLIITPGFPGGEAEKSCLPSVQNFVLSLNNIRQNIDIQVYTLSYPFARSSYFWNGIKVTSFNFNKRKKGLFRFLHVFNLLKAIAYIFNNNRNKKIAGILCFWYGETAIVGKIVGRLVGTDCKIWMHGQDARRKNKFIKYFKPNSNELIAISDYQANELWNSHRIKAGYIVPNGIDPTQFSFSGQKIIDIIGVGSLIPLKRYEIFLKVVKDIKEMFPGVKAVLIGDGPERDAIETRIAEMGIEDSIELKGALPHEETLEWMSKSKILLHPSSYEGYSTCCLEALYAGCHVISFFSAENRPIDNWHIVSSEREMLELCKKLLLSDISPSKVLVHSMEDVAGRMAGIFNF